MNLDTQLAVLDQIYKVHDDFARTLDVACKRSCAECCTCNVTLTTLEGYKLAQYMALNGRSELFETVRTESSEKRFQPQMTTNALADICMQGKEPPEEENDPSWGRCPLLTNDECPVYRARPFGCRCFVSNQVCGKTGYADVDPFIIAVNNVFLQYIEHIDKQGGSGNLTDILLFMESSDNRQRYEHGVLKGSCPGIIPNHPIKAMLVSPEHRDRVMPIIQAIQRINVPKNEGNGI